MKKESGPRSRISAVSSPRAGRCDWLASFISQQKFLFFPSVVNFMFLNLQLKINPLKTNNRCQLVKTLLCWEILLSERCLKIKSASFCHFKSRTQLSNFGNLHCYNVAVSNIEVCVCAENLSQMFRLQTAFGSVWPQREPISIYGHPRHTGHTHLCTCCSDLLFIRVAQSE